MPEISVIVPVYRAEAFLRKCTESILAQTMGELEVLLIDDGSPDGSGALCDQIAGEDSRVRVFHKENGGVSSARNLGMAQARGTYLSFVDADDWLPADALETLYRALREAGADTAGGAHNRVETDGRQEKEPGALPAGVYGPEEIRRGIVDRLLGERMGKPGEVLNGFVWRFLFSREIIQGHNMAFAGAYLSAGVFLLCPEAGHGGPAGVPISAKSRVRHPAVSAGLYADLSGLYEGQGGPGPAHGPGGKYAPLAGKLLLVGAADRHWQ